MSIRCLRLVLAAVLLASATPSFANVVIGDFEQTAPGWGRWSGGVQPFDGNYAYTTDGATLNQYAIQYTNAGWSQSLAYSAGNAGTIGDFLAHDKILVDITFPATQFDGWAQVFEIAVNSQYGGWIGADYSGQGVGWGPGGGGAQTITLEYDYSSGATDHKTAWANNGVPGWIEIIFATNSDANHGVFQFDNVRLVSDAPVIPEPASLTLVALVSLVLMGVRRRPA